MSLQFSDTTNYRGLLQVYERDLGLTLGYVSGDTRRRKEFTADVNLALDDFTQLALTSSGTWQWDDTNHTDYPIITRNLVASQRDYTFTQDESNNLILEIYKVMVADSSGTFREIKPKDVQSEDDTVGFYDGKNTTGAPAYYDKTGNGIFLEPIPDFSYTNGLKVYINREASYFTDTDTTKKAGIPGIFHRYLTARACYDYARRHNLVIQDRFRLEVQEIEQKAYDYFSRRSRDERKRLSVSNESNK